MRLTDKNKIKELATLQKNNVLMTDADYKELKLGKLEDILEKYNIENNDELEVLCKYVEDVKHWKSIHEEKMLEIKRIEEEIGIDLITLFKALRDGIWIRNTIFENGEIKNLLFFYEDVNLYKDCLYACPVDIYDERVCINKYGTTWALTKEELENDK